MDRPTVRPNERIDVLILSIVFGLLAAGLIVWGSVPSPALTPDSTAYLNAASNIRRGAGIVNTLTPIGSNVLSVPFAAWPPLYPLAIAALLPILGDPVSAARLLQVLATVLMAIPIGFLTYRAAGRRLLLPVLAFFAILRPIVLVGTFVWSEPLFMLFTYSAIAVLVEGMGGEDCRAPGKRGCVLHITAGILAGCSMLTRYIGFTVILTGAIVLATSDAEGDPIGRRTIRKLAAFVVPAVVPNLAWLVRNFVTTGFLFGENRAGAIQDPQSVVLSTLQTFWVDITMPHAIDAMPARLIVSVLSFTSFLVLLSAWLTYFGPEMFHTGRKTSSAINTLTLFGVLYSMAIVGISFGISYDPINSRFLAPLYPALLILGAAPLRLARTRRMRTIAIAATLLFSIQTAAMIRYVTGPREDRSQTNPYWRSTVFATPRWARDPAIRGACSMSSPGTPILSNIADVFALWTDRPAKQLPLRRDSNLGDLISRHPGAVVLIHPAHRRLFVGVEEMERLVAGGKCVSLGARGEGRLYRVLAGPPESTTGGMGAER
jgi:4-amino-4-deoxy-L-arabinose transferase-like glycosyltransferase